MGACKTYFKPIQFNKNNYWNSACCSQFSRCI